jgi:hypothetical protein
LFGSAFQRFGQRRREWRRGGDLRSAAQNPISSLISLPLKLTLDQGASNGDAQVLNANP